MYREWKGIELCLFGDLKRMERNMIVLFWGFTENEMKWNFVCLGIYSELKDIGFCCFRHVHLMEGYRILKKKYFI
jgi:hypothetical protein